MVQPNCFHSTSQQFRFLRQCPERCADRPRLDDMGSILDEGISDTRETESAISGGNLQYFKPRKFQYAKSDRRGVDPASRGQHDGLDSLADKSDRGSDHEHVDRVAAGAIRTEAALVGPKIQDREKAKKIVLMSTVGGGRL